MEPNSDAEGADDTAEAVQQPPAPRRAGYSRLSEETKSRLIRLCVEDNRPIREALAGTDVLPSTANSFIRRFIAARGEVRKHGGVRTVKVTPAIRAAVLQFANDDSTLTLRSVAGRLEQTLHVRLSTSTIARIYDSANYTLKVVRLVPRGRNTPEAIEARARFVATLDGADAPPPNRVIYVDESGFNCHLRRRHGRAPIGQRATATVVNSRGVNLSICAAMHINGMLTWTHRWGAFNAGFFVEYLQTLFSRLDELSLEHCWVVLDNVRFHHSAAVTDIITARGHTPVYLPPYSPMLNPIESAFSKWKSSIRRTGEIRHRDELLERVQQAHREISRDDCIGWIHEATRH
jgi:hypothetical protein